MSKIIYILSLIITIDLFVVSVAYVYEYATISDVLSAWLVFMGWLCCLMLTYIYRELRS
jgi:hypothetical protein